MYDWTDEQLEAINAVGSPIIVSAAAGSGKTAVLVERTIRLLCDEKLNIPADTLLAVTFTNDAAAQMSQKLSQEIDLRAESEPDNAWIQRQQSLLRLSEITTINSFCYNLVKDNLADTDFQSGVRILEENEADMLTDRALTEVLETEYAERPAETEELISLFCRENDSALRRMILQLYRFLRSLPFPRLWLKNAIDDLIKMKAAERIFETFDSQAKEILGLIKSTSSRLRSLASALEYHSAAKKVLADNCDIADAYADSASCCQREQVSEFISNIVWKPLTVRQTKLEKESSSELEAGIYESAKECYSHLKDLFSELSGIYKYTEEDIKSDSKKVAHYFERLAELCLKLDDRAYEMKVEKNALDFADTELISVSLLVGCDENGRVFRKPLAEEIVASKRYRVILIDEFQDVNNLQELIFKAISDTSNLSEIGNNLFAVGDVKQAIYRFRQANPQIFMKTRAQGKSKESAVRELLLRKNFRSRKSVLDFCNYVFGALMSRRVGETDYTDEEALVLGSDFETDDPPTEIITVNDDGSEELSTVEFTAVARRIRALINEKAPVRENGAFRPCRPSDFCVLTRTNVTGSELSDIFAKEGLRVLTNDTSGYLRSREISLLLNLLAIISNPMQDVPLVSVMLSPILGFSDDDVATLRIFSREDKIYKIMLAVSDGGYGADAALKEKCAGAVRLLKRLSILASGLTLTKLIRKIYDLTDIFAMASAYEDGAQKCANLYLLLEYARSYEQASPDGVEGFLRYIEYISKSGGDFEQALTVTETGDAVSIKTVHRSKGLEYPFVFICQTRKRFNTSDLNGPLMLNAEVGAGLSFLDYSTLTKRPTAFWENVRAKNRSELLSEELRLLYVAMTRAKERLFIVLDMSDRSTKRAAELSYEICSGKIPPAAVQRALCTADWLFMALMRHPGFAALRSKLGPGICTDSGKLPEIKVAGMPPSPSESVESEEKSGVIDNSLAKKIAENFRLSPDERLTSNEAKLTVSEIVKDDALSFFPQVPSLDESLDEFTAAQRGTITHRFMQFCDLNAASDDLEAEISRLCKINVFTPKEAEAVDRPSVRKFFQSEIYSRLRSSGRVLREQRFIVGFNDIKADLSVAEDYRGTDGMLQGVADCLFEEEDGYVLVDYKTDRVKSCAQLAERYSAQLELYKAAFDILLEKPVKSCFIYSFRLGDGIEISAKNFVKTP